MPVIAVLLMLAHLLFQTAALPHRHVAGLILAHDHGGRPHVHLGSHSHEVKARSQEIAGSDDRDWVAGFVPTNHGDDAVYLSCDAGVTLLSKAVVDCIPRSELGGSGGSSQPVGLAQSRAHLVQWRSTGPPALESCLKFLSHRLRI